MIRWDDALLPVPLLLPPSSSGEVPHSVKGRTPPGSRRGLRRSNTLSRQKKTYSKAKDASATLGAKKEKREQQRNEELSLVVLHAKHTHISMITQNDKKSVLKKVPTRTIPRVAGTNEERQ